LGEVYAVCRLIYLDGLMQVGCLYAHFTDCTSRLLKELISLEGEEVRVWISFGCWAVCVGMPSPRVADDYY